MTQVHPAGEVSVGLPLRSSPSPRKLRTWRHFSSGLADALSRASESVRCDLIDFASPMSSRGSIA